MSMPANTGINAAINAEQTFIASIEDTASSVTGLITIIPTTSADIYVKITPICLLALSVATPLHSAQSMTAAITAAADFIGAAALSITDCIRDENISPIPKSVIEEGSSAFTPMSQIISLYSSGSASSSSPAPLASSCSSYSCSADMSDDAFSSVSAAAGRIKQKATAERTIKMQIYLNILFIFYS